MNLTYKIPQKLRPSVKENIDKIDWTNLSFNPNAIHILEKNLDKVSWYCLSENPNTIHILEKIWIRLIGGYYHLIQMQYIF